MRKSMLLCILLCGSSVLFGCNQEVDKVETVNTESQTVEETSSGELPTVVETPQVEQSTEVIKPEVEVQQEEAKITKTEDGKYVVYYFDEPAFELTIDSVRYTNERNQFYDDVPVESVAVIRITGTNIGSEAHYLSDSYFNFYGEGGTKLDTYPNTDTEYSCIEELNPNRTATIEISIGIQKGSYLEVEIMDDASSDGLPIESLFFE